VHTAPRFARFITLHNSQQYSPALTHLKFHCKGACFVAVSLLFLWWYLLVAVHEAPQGWREKTINRRVLQAECSS
jgi:hypothetical protein